MPKHPTVPTATCMLVLVDAHAVPSVLAGRGGTGHEDLVAVLARVAQAAFAAETDMFKFCGRWNADT